MVFIGVLVAASALIWAVVLWAARLPDHSNRAAVYGLVIGVVGVIPNAAFWTRLPLGFGAGAIDLGRRAQQRADHGAPDQFVSPGQRQSLAGSRSGYGSSRTCSCRTSSPN